MSDDVRRRIAEIQKHLEAVGAAHNAYSGPCAACAYTKDVPWLVAELTRALDAVNHPPLKVSVLTMEHAVKTGATCDVVRAMLAYAGKEICAVEFTGTERAAVAAIKEFMAEQEAGIRKIEELESFKADYFPLKVIKKCVEVVRTLAGREPKP